MTASMPDRIALRGLRVRGHHGVFDHERTDGQEFVIDVTLDVDISAAARTDDLRDTIDYGEVARAVAAVVGGEPLNLIETLAERIAAACLADSRIASVEVSVHKPYAPVPLTFDDVIVTIVRSRGADE